MADGRAGCARAGEAAKVASVAIATWRRSARMRGQGGGRQCSLSTLTRTVRERLTRPGPPGTPLHDDRLPHDRHDRAEHADPAPQRRGQWSVRVRIALV